MSTATLKALSFMPVLTVEDLKKTMSLYTGGLGFTIVEENKNKAGELVGVTLGAGDARLGFSQDDFAKGRNRVKGVGMRLYLETDQDLPALARQARSAGLKLDGDPAPLPWGPLGLTVSDPDGYRFTISNVS